MMAVKNKLLIAAAFCSIAAGAQAQVKKKSPPKKTNTAPAAAVRRVTPDFVKSPDNLDYKWIVLGSGTQAAAVGDYGEMHVIFKIGDTVMINTAEMNNHIPVTQQITAPGIKGDLMEGLVRMRSGDSAVFRMPADTFAQRAHQPKPEWVKKGDYVTWEIRMVRVMTKAQMDADIAAKEQRQNAIDDARLQEYFRKHNITDVHKTASGLCYTIRKEGIGPKPAAGQTVTVNYTGQNCDGAKFDSNTDPAFNHVEPFSFVIGKRNVIRGWDEAVAVMNAGMKATFYIPSSLAYGERGAGPKIGPNEILIFDIELLSFK